MLQQLENDPAYKTGHDIGIQIGKFLPFILLVIFIFLIFYFIRKKKQSK